MRTYFWAASVGFCIAVLSFGLYYSRPTATSQRISDCKGLENSQAARCFTKLITDIFERDGLPTALKTVADISAVDSDFAKQCHNDMHTLGHVAYTSFRKHGDIELTPEVSYCDYGFFHGFMEEMARQSGSTDQAREFCDAVARNLPGQRAAESNCYHGIGHGTTDGSDPITWGDPVAMVKPGLKTCREITDDEEFLGSCDMGVFNSVELMYPNPKYKLTTNGHPFALCRNGIFSDTEKRACYVEMSVLTMDMVSGDFSKAFNFATDAEVALREFAARYLALYSFSAAVRPDPLAVFLSCKIRWPEFRDACVQGVMQGLQVYGTPEREHEEITAFCTDQHLSIREQDICIDTAVRSNSYTEADRILRCNWLPEPFRNRNETCRQLLDPKRTPETKRSALL